MTESVQIHHPIDEEPLLPLPDDLDMWTQWLPHFYEWVDEPGGTFTWKQGSEPWRFPQ